MYGGDQQLNLPAGFRFHPTDEELVEHYLCRKCASQQISVPFIAEIDLYKFDPWQLPGKALYGEKEWYFFSPRDRKYPNGSRPNRAAGTGYWKATGADKAVGKPKTLGIKKSLVFYAGKSPKGVKTNWIMHEYRLANVDRSVGKRSNSRLDDWILCRIYNKKGTLEKYFNVDQNEVEFSDTDEQEQDIKPNADPFPYNKLITTAPQFLASRKMNDYLHFDTSDSVPKLHTDSSSSEHALSSDCMADKEVQSQPRWSDFENSLELQLDFFDGLQNEPFISSMQYNGQVPVSQDIFAYTRPF